MFVTPGVSIPCPTSSKSIWNNRLSTYLREEIMLLKESDKHDVLGTNLYSDCGASPKL
jgi:hypothetical protein